MSLSDARALPASAHKAAERAILKVLGDASEPMGAEAIIAHCEAYDVRMDNSSAFGPVFALLRRRGLIERDGYYVRRNGSDGICWRLTSAGAKV